MILLASPIAAFEARLQVESLRAELAKHDLDEVVKARVDAFYEWDQVQDPIARRFQKNSTLVFTREELESYVRMQVVQLLRHAPDLLGGP